MVQCIMLWWFPMLYFQKWCLFLNEIKVEVNEKDEYIIYDGMDKINLNSNG